MLSRGQHYQELSDEQLAKLAVKDREAFAEIYSRHLNKVYSYVHYRTFNPADTQDIVAATFLKALDHIGDFRSRGGGLGAWLLRIARNQTTDNFRRQQKVLPLPDDAWPVDTDSPEQQAVRKDQAAELRRLVDRLPAAQRELIILKFSLGLSNQEIAHVTGRSETAVSSLQHRALQNLRSGVEH